MNAASQTIHCVTDPCWHGPRLTPGKGNVCARVRAYALALAAVDESLFTVHS